MIGCKRIDIFIFLFLLSAQLFQLVANKKVCIGQIEIINTKITKDNTILRELPFRSGEEVDSTRLDQLIRDAKVNLVNTSLFNFVEVTRSAVSEEGRVDVSISVTERWYIWPVIDIIFEDSNLSAWLKDPKTERVTFNVGGRVENFLGMNNTLSATATVGFQKGFKLNFSNISLDSDGAQYLSAYGGMGLNYSTNVSVEDNAPHFLKARDRYVSEAYHIGATYTYRKNVRRRHSINLEIEHKYIDDTILVVNPDFWGTQDNRKTAASLSYSYTHDERDYVHYPTNGYYVFGMLRTSSDTKFNVMYAQLRGDFRYYRPIFGRWVASTTIKTGTSIKNERAYVFDRAIGYDDVNLRGYESYVADGQHYVVNNNTVTFNILPRKEFNIGFLRKVPQFGKIHCAIYGRAYCDLGYTYHDYPTVYNRLSNRLLISGGVGIDVVTFYDIILMFDYSFTREGTHGFFFRIRTPFF